MTIEMDDAFFRRMDIERNRNKVELVNGIYIKKKGKTGVDWELLCACSKCHRPSKRTPTKMHHYKRCFDCNNKLQAKREETLRLDFIRAQKAFLKDPSNF
jgi:hypothetical protein